jgi:hypothetical protein
MRHRTEVATADLSAIIRKISQLTFTEAAIAPLSIRDFC